MKIVRNVLTPSEIAKRCIACDKKRAKDSGFCTEHKAAHKKSKLVKAWRLYQKKVSAEIKKTGSMTAYKNVLWAPPKD